MSGVLLRLSLFWAFLLLGSIGLLACRQENESMTDSSTEDATSTILFDLSFDFFSFKTSYLSVSQVCCSQGRHCNCNAGFLDRLGLTVGIYAHPFLSVVYSMNLNSS